MSGVANFIVVLRTPTNVLSCSRFGQTVLQDCEYCSTFDEYALYALPWALMGYIREAATIGALTIQGSGRERWRTYGVATVVVTAVIEGYCVATATIKIPRDGSKVYMVCVLISF